MNCIVCDKPVSKKARTCSDKCKQQAYRNGKRNESVTVTPNVTVENVTVADLELCRYCDKPLPPLAKPRRNPGACYPCAMKAVRGPSVDKLGDTVWAGSERPTDELIALDAAHGA